MTLLLIGVLASFFALNMGGSGLGAAFAPAYGAKMLSRFKAGILFIVCVMLGAMINGAHVTATLGRGIIPSEFISEKALIVIFLSAGLGMFSANVLRIPQSTSHVTVAAIAGVGIHLGTVNTSRILYMVPFWVLLPVVSFVMAYALAGYSYPPRRINFWLYEKLLNKQESLRKLVIIASCYSSFAIGTNNVANVIGPISGYTSFDLTSGLVAGGAVLGLGGFIFSGPLKTSGEKIVPLGYLTASIVSLVSGTLLIIASRLGIPQSFVMLQLTALFAIASVKHGKTETFADRTTKLMFLTWMINPLIIVVVSWGLSTLIIG
jgi:sulfate permease